MSAPDTDVDKQAKRHAGPIIGIGALLVFVAILLVVYLYYEASPGNDTLDLTPNSEAAISIEEAPAISAEEAIVTPEDAEIEPMEAPAD